MRLSICIALAFAALLSAARAADLSRYCGQPIDNRQINITRNLDPRVCSDNCFQFVLTCRDGRKFNLTSRFNPYDPDWLHGLTLIYPFPQMIVFAAIAFLVFVAWMGTPLSLAANLTYLGIAGLAMFFWPAIATGAGAGADFTGMAIVFALFGLPIFLVLNLKALMRGWNYLFVQHSAEPIIAPALSAGRSIDTNALADELEAGARAPGAHAAYHWENQAEKARALAHKLEAARAEMAAAERALEAAKARRESKT
jgi:hypothetical protein